MGKKVHGAHQRPHVNKYAHKGQRPPHLNDGGQNLLNCINARPNTRKAQILDHLENLSYLDAIDLIQNIDETELSFLKADTDFRAKLGRHIIRLCKNMKSNQDYASYGRLVLACFRKGLLDNFANIGFENTVQIALDKLSNPKLLSWEKKQNLLDRAQYAYDLATEVLNRKNYSFSQTQCEDRISWVIVNLSIIPEQLPNAFDLLIRLLEQEDPPTHPINTRAARFCTEAITNPENKSIILELGLTIERCTKLLEQKRFENVAVKMRAALEEIQLQSTTVANPTQVTAPETLHINGNELTKATAAQARIEMQEVKDFGAQRRDEALLDPDEREDHSDSRGSDIDALFQKGKRAEKIRRDFERRNKLGDN